MGESGGFGRESVVLRIGEGGGPPGAAAAPPAVEKYDVAARIGTGGMGEVLLVEDRDLKRQVAMKVLRPEYAASRSHRLKFLAEAQATSQLDHPGVPPVHDMGLTPGGQVYFTMKLVRGQTLRLVLQEVLLGRKEVRREFTLHRLISILERLCETLHFAHEKGVVHRDLKPENIMLGDYGEVHLMDWGIAKVLETGEEELAEDRVRTEIEGPGTQTGTLKGTIPYMSPEQASGGRVDRRADVYALGCVLYEVLTLYPAFEGEPGEILRRVRAGDFPAVETRNPRRPVPESLGALCRRAMAREPEARPATAREFGAALRAWLDGSAESGRRHREAEGLAAKGKAAAARYAALRIEAAAAAEAAAAEAGRFRSWQPLEEKRPAVEARSRAAATRRAAVRAFAETTRLLEAALVAEETNATARAALAALWRGRLEEAERLGNREDADYALDLVARYDDGSLARVVSGDGSLALASEPAGAEVELHRYEDRLGVLHEGPPRRLGRTPLGPVGLPMGSYLCVLRMPGFRDVRYPVYITRNRAWEGLVRMRTEAEIGEGFVLVPAGPFVSGEGKDSCTLELPDYAIARYPVTFEEYAEFLAATEREGGAEAARKHLPRTESDGALMARGEDGTWSPRLDRFVDPRLVPAGRGEEYQARIPVVGVDWEDAAAYCAWKSRATGREWRLPTDREREKAARGVDGRRFPWGEVEDSSLGKCFDSRDGESRIEPVGAFPTAASVYGAGDMAGGVWDWVDAWFDRDRSLRIRRGGSWFHTPGGMRCATYSYNTPDDRFTYFGFRCARNLP